MSSGPRARRPTPLWVSLTLIAAIAWPYWVWLYRLCASLHYNDFGKFYYGVVAWRQGRSLYSLTPASFVGDVAEPLTNLNPPHAMLAVLPFSFLQVDWAFALWMAVNGVCLAFVMTRVCRTIGWHPTFWQLVVLLAGAPTATWLVTGQLSGLLAVPLIFAWLAWRKGDQRAAGVWLGVAVSVKPFLGLLLLWMLWRREWRAVTTAAVCATALFVCGLLTFGMQSHVDWVASLRAVTWPWRAMNASILGIVTRAFTVTPSYVPFAVLPIVVVPIWLAAAGGIVVLLVARLRRASIDDAWGLLLAAALLISPLGWAYYLWWALAGLRGMTSRASSALLVLPLPVVALNVFPEQPPWVSFTLGSAYGWALFGGFLAMRSARADT